MELLMIDGVYTSLELNSLCIELIGSTTKVYMAI